MANDFEGGIARFVDDVQSLKRTSDLLMAVLTLTRRESRKELDAFVDQAGLKKREADGKTVYTVSPDHAARFKKLLQRLTHGIIADRIVPRSYVVMLVSQFDAFLGRLIREMFVAQPGLLNASERQLTFSQLSSFGSIDAARDFVVEQEVDAILRESHAAHFRWLENKLSMPLRKGLPIWPTYVELTERRNLFVHTDGVVTRQYIEVCQEHGVPLDNAVTVGTQLGVPRSYFAQACDTMLELGVKLGHVIWRKLAPDDRAAADAALNLLCYDMIAAEDHHLAVALLTFATESIKTHASEEIKLYMLINRAQALKWSGDAAACAALLDGLDWSAKAPHLQLAKAVLIEDDGAAVAIMKQLGGENDKVPRNAYVDWPLFREFRKKQACRDAYANIFCLPFPESTEELAPPPLEEGGASSTG